MAAPTHGAGQAVKDYVRDMIRSGRWAPGARLPSYRSLGRKFDTSVGSVQRALRDLADEGIVVTVQGSGTYVGEAPEIEASGRHILVVAPELPAVSALRELALARGVIVAHYSTRLDCQDPGTERRLLETALASRQFDVVLTPTPNPPINVDLFAQLREAGLKVLLTGWYDREMADEACLLPDFVHAGRSAAIQAALAGYRHIVYAWRGPGELMMHWRMLRDGHDEAVREFALPTLPDLLMNVPDAWGLLQGDHDQTVLGELRGILPRLRNLPPRTVIVTPHNGLTTMLLELLAEAGRRSPGDVGLICNNFHFPDPAISGMVFDMEALVAEALDYVTDPAIPPTAPYRQHFRARFVAGASTIPPPHADERSPEP